MIFMIIKFIVAMIVFCGIILAVYIYLKGKEKFIVDVEKRTAAKLISVDTDKIIFNVAVPVKNDGREEAAILDAFTRIYLPEKQYSEGLLRARVNLSGNPRNDEYFEAILMPAGANINLIVSFELIAQKNFDFKQGLMDMPEVDVALFLDCRGRGDLYTLKNIITLNKIELQNMLEK